MSETTGERTVEAVDDFGQALGALMRRYLDGARDATADLPGGPRGFQVLVNASGADCSNQATIAQRLGIDRTVMTYLVDDLERAGLVERRPDPADRRARQVLRTPQGDATLVDVRRRIADVEDLVMGSLSSDDAASFRRLLGAAAVGAPRTDHSLCDVAESDLGPAC